MDPATNARWGSAIAGRLWRGLGGGVGFKKFISGFHTSSPPPLQGRNRDRAVRVLMPLAVLRSGGGRQEHSSTPVPGDEARDLLTGRDGSVKAGCQVGENSG